MAFLAAMKSVYTWNGAISNSTPDLTGEKSGRLSLFFKAMRGCSNTQLYEYLEKASKEDLVDTIVLAFHVRDSRGGKGERELGRRMLSWLFVNYPRELQKVYQLVPEYGRWDDLLVLFPTCIKNYIEWLPSESLTSDDHCLLQQSIINLYTQQLKTDKKLMEEGKPISICAKWCPSEGDSKDKKYKLVDTLTFNMDINSREYRKEYITPLRTYLNIVEKFMCSGRWDEIEYSKVPSCAIKKLKKAFEKHSPEHFKSWKESLSKGEVKVNANQLFPHELVKEMRTTGKCDEVCKAQWKVLEEEVRKLGALSKAVVVVDTSGSMTCNNYLPLDIATGMGLLVSNVVEGEFHGNVISFNTNPRFAHLKDDDIYKRYQQMLGMDWGGSTNIQATFDMILERGVKAGLKQEDMPETIFIISDMQFNGCAENASRTNFEIIKHKYNTYDYKMPRLVFWNVNGSSTDFPVTVDDNGTCLVSGASPSILKSILNCKEFSSYGIMRTELDSDRYKPVRELLEHETHAT